MTNITGFAMAKRQVTWLVIIVIFFSGIAAFFDIPRAQDPGFKIRTAQVITRLPGATPERVELLVTDKLEKKIQELPELDSIVSQSKSGISIINVNIKESYSELRPIWDKLRRKVEAAQVELPDDAYPSEVNDDFGDVFGIVVSIIGEGFSLAETRDVADEVRNKLLLLPLVAKVDIYGAQEERIYVEYNNSKLVEYGLSPAYLAQYLQNKNIITSGGEIITHDEIISVEPSGDLDSVLALRETYIPIPGSKRVIPMEDIATVYRDYTDPPRTLVHTNGQRSLSLAISVTEGGNVVDLGKQTQALLSDLQEIYPWGYRFEIVAFQPYLVTKTIQSFVTNLLQAIAVVTFTMLLTLGLRTGLVVASLIPVTIFATITLMNYFKIGLDQVSLAALMIALGMLVDNAIVMSESTITRMEEGQSGYNAAYASAMELKIPLLISSLTTAAAFLPIYLAESSTGEYTAPIFKVVTIALLTSWVLAITMIPLFASVFLKIKKSSEQQGIFTKIENIYAVLLAHMLNKKYLTLLIMFSLFMLAIFGFRFIPTVFFPPSEDPNFKIELELPIGTPISKTESTVSQLELYLNDLLEGENKPGIVNWISYIGNGGPRYVLNHSAKLASPNYAFFVVNASNGEIVNELIPKIEAHLYENFVDVTASVRKLDMGVPILHPIEIRIAGPNKNTLLQLRENVKSQLQNISGTKNISDDWGRQTKKLYIDIDEVTASRLGISNIDVAQSLRTSLSGVKVSEYREGDITLPVILRAEREFVNGTLLPTSINVFAQNSQTSVPAGQLGKPQLQWESAIIHRRNRVPSVSIFADLKSGYTATQVNALLTTWLTTESQSWPKDFSWEFGGEAESSGKANQSISEKLPIAAMIILLLLIVQFNNYRKTLIILMTIPLGIIGVVFGLIVGKSYLGFMTILGIISLAGIVINNAIVLIDRIQIEQEENGLDVAAAIEEAARRRLRPVLLTTATTVLGMIPLWLGGGVMWEPMAIAIIFGLLGATALTLGFVPTAYAALFKAQKTQDVSALSS